MFASVVAETDGGSISSFVVVYSPDGRLVERWEVIPYHHREIAVDPEGNVFGWGSGPGPGSHPLLVKYTPEGRVSGRTECSTLPGGGLVVGPRDSLDAFADKLVLFAGEELELLVFDLEGQMRQRLPL